MKLHNYETGDFIRMATLAEYESSVAASKIDGGAGVITIDGVRCYVDGEPEQAEESQTVEWMSERHEAACRAVPVAHLRPTDANSIVALFDRMRERDDAYNLSLSRDGSVGAWTCPELLAIGKNTRVVARLLDGVVYWGTR